HSAGSASELEMPRKRRASERAEEERPPSTRVTRSQFKKEVGPSRKVKKGAKKVEKTSEGTEKKIRMTADVVISDQLAYSSQDEESAEPTERRSARIGKKDVSVPTAGRRDVMKKKAAEIKQITAPPTRTRALSVITRQMVANLVKGREKKEKKTIKKEMKRNIARDTEESTVDTEEEQEDAPHDTEGSTVETDDGEETDEDTVIEKKDEMEETVMEKEDGEEVVGVIEEEDTIVIVKSGSEVFTDDKMEEEEGEAKEDGEEVVGVIEEEDTVVIVKNESGGILNDKMDEEEGEEKKEEQSGTG
ncbi:hypothetical protein PFISCL1PPCAC_23428, partial [Pristionchus fissidentatus]